MTVQRVTDKVYVGKFITFDKRDYTHVNALNPYYWEVSNTKDGSRLGYIEWFKKWKKFSFFNYEEPCVFEEICLGDIADFLIFLTKEKKKLDNVDPY
jgi:hypothetical protein